MLTDDGIVIILLNAPGLLVHTQMEMLGSKRLTDLTDKIGADIAVLLGGKNIGILLQPDVVTCREVQLGDGLKTHRAQTRHLFGHLVLGPGALHRQLGVRLVQHTLAYIDNDGVGTHPDEIFHISVPQTAVQTKHG